MSPYKKWNGSMVRLKGIYPFGTIGYLRASKRKNKLEPRGRKCVLVGWDMNRSQDTYTVMDVVTRQLSSEEM